MRFALVLSLLPLTVLAAITATIAPAPWDLYKGASIVKSGLASESACIEAAKSLGVVRSYTCRTRTSVTVSVTANQPNTATLSWVAPTLNTDGSTLTNLAGYRIYYGTSPALNQVIEVPVVSNYVVSNLTPGTWYFGLKAFNAAGIESDLSNIASKAIN